MHPRLPLVLVAFALFAGCASVPQYRPIYDLPSERNIEAGVVPQLGIAFDPTEGALTGVVPVANAWGTFRTAADLDLFVAGHGGLGVSLVDGSYGGNQFGVSAGVRYRVQQDFLPDMRFGFEAYGDYWQDDMTFIGDGRTTRRHISVVARIPISQRVPNSSIWVYTAPTVGIALPLYDEAPFPFHGIREMPIGLVAGVTDWLSIVVEGGYLMPPLNGGYLGVGAIFTL